MQNYTDELVKFHPLSTVQWHCVQNLWWHCYLFLFIAAYTALSATLLLCACLRQAPSMGSGASTQKDVGPTGIKDVHLNHAVTTKYMALSQHGKVQAEFLRRKQGLSDASVYSQDWNLICTRVHTPTHTHYMALSTRKRGWPLKRIYQHCRYVVTFVQS